MKFGVIPPISNTYNSIYSSLMQHNEETLQKALYQFSKFCKSGQMEIVSDSEVEVKLEVKEEDLKLESKEEPNEASTIRAK